MLMREILPCCGGSRAELLHRDDIAPLLRLCNVQDVFITHKTNKTIQKVKQKIQESSSRITSWLKCFKPWFCLLDCFCFCLWTSSCLTRAYGVPSWIRFAALCHMTSSGPRGSPPAESPAAPLGVYHLPIQLNEALLRELRIT